MRHKDDSTPQATSAVKCCRCGHPVEAPSGWCGDCALYPKNVAPKRFCRECGKPADVDGFCWACRDYTMTSLELRESGWHDTGKVSTIMPEAQHLALMRELDRINTTTLLKGQPTVRDLEAEKRALKALEVPF